MKDESAREKALEKLLTEKLRSQAGVRQLTDECADAEILAAYVERALALRERTAWEAHFALCARCQERIAALLRLSEEEEPASRQVPGRARVARFRWAWAASVLVAVTVAGLWYRGEFAPLLRSPKSRMGAPARVPARSSMPQAATEAKPEIVPIRKEPAETRKPPTEAMAGEETPASRANGPAPSPQREPARRAGGRPEIAGARAGSEPAPPGPAAAKREAVPPPATRGEVVAPLAASQRVMAPPSAHARMETGLEGAATGAAAGVANESQSERAKSSTSQAQEREAIEAPRTRKPMAQAEGFIGRPAPAFHYAMAPARLDAAGQVIAPASLWRVGPRGLVQKGGPDGLWENKPGGVVEDLLDVTFPSSQAGWIVGRHGTVLRSATGGDSWERVSSPTDQDLVRVTSQSAESAQVTTRSGTAFSTTDGGKSWHLSRPQ